MILYNCFCEVKKTHKSNVVPGLSYLRNYSFNAPVLSHPVGPVYFKKMHICICILMHFWDNTGNISKRFVLIERCWLDQMHNLFAGFEWILRDSRALPL